MLLVANCASAKEPTRIWVDDSGRYSIEAALVERRTDSVVLLRRDGGRATMPVARLSKQDKEYLADYDARIVARADKQKTKAPAAPKNEPLLRLDFPKAAFQAPGVAELMLGVVTQTTAQKASPQGMPADRSPDEIKFPEVQVPMTKIDSYDSASNLVSVGSEEEPLLGMSVSIGFSLPGQHSQSHLIRIAPKTGHASVVFESRESITLLDHHHASGRSLVLLDHNPLGHGGRLAMATGWDSGEVKIELQRSLPAMQGIGKFPHLRWAKWLDEENVVAIINQSLVRWNIVSGEKYYRIDGVNDQAVPALSGGRRYLALPVVGAALLYDTEDAKPLGRLDSEPKSVPGVSFAPHGGEVAVATSRRLRTYDLTSGRLSSDISSRRSLGREAPVWLDHDLVLSSSGVLVSLFRGIPVWRYQITGASPIALGDRMGLLRKHPTTSVVVLKMPHAGAIEAMQWVDEHPRQEEIDDWKLPGRSVWDVDNWIDRDLRIGSASEKILR